MRDLRHADVRIGEHRFGSLEFRQRTLTSASCFVTDSSRDDYGYEKWPTTAVSSTHCFEIGVCQRSDRKRCAAFGAKGKLPSSHKDGFHCSAATAADSAHTSAQSGNSRICYSFMGI
jgi:hypothetical protein